MTEPLEPRLRRILAETFEIDEARVGDDTTMEGLDAWDSLSHMTLIVALEGEIGCKFSPEEIVRMTSFGAIRRIVEERS